MFWNANQFDFNEIDEDMPLELMELAQVAKLETMPAKSKEKYNRVYQNFMWDGKIPC